MEEVHPENAQPQSDDTYYPLPLADSIMGAADESFVPWNVYMTLQSSIQFADYKINLLFVIAGVILSMVIDSAEHFKDEHLGYKLCFIAFMIATIPFIYYSVLTIAAQVSSKPDVKSRKLYFFGEISSMPTSEYIHRFRSTPRKDHYDELLLQIHNLSHIAKQKFKNYGKALYLLCVMMAIMILMFVFKMY